MAEVELTFGTIGVRIKDTRRTLEEIDSIAHSTLSALIPVAEKMLIAERKLCAEQCSEQDDGEDGSQDPVPPKKDAMFV